MGKVILVSQSMAGGNMFNLISYAAIDPLALIFPSDVYAVIAKIRHPHVPKLAETLFKCLTERSYLLERLAKS
jgi:hypothetical protein